MTILAELSYDNEETFVDRFLIPLLQRLGFSLLVNYHGTTEFGKDVVFGEIDRFGHVVYHALQAKYVSSISLNAIEDIISDAKQAFANPFKHPQRGNDERISTFTAVNGGSISSQAYSHFFNSLVPTYGSNVRLLDGKALLMLDRSTAFAGIQLAGERLMGLLLELRNNRMTLGNLLQRLEEFVAKDTAFPIFRLRLAAVTAYLESPFASITLPIDLIEQYWQLVRSVNDAAASMDQRLKVVGFKEARLEGINEMAPQIHVLALQIETAVDGLLTTLGPLAPM